MSKFLDEFCELIKKTGYNIYHVAEIQNGNAPEERELVPSNPCQDIYSVSKVFCVAAVGLMYDRGLLTPDTLVKDILKEEMPENADSRWSLTTVEMLLKHRTGLPWGFLDIDCCDATTFGDDYLNLMLTYPLTCTPGEQYAYTDGAFYLLGRIVSKLAGEKIQDLMRHEFFTPLGFRELAWSCCPMGYAMGATGIYTRACDAAKIGEIFRQNGEYMGKRYLSEEWCRLAYERCYELGVAGSKGTLRAKGGMLGQMLLYDTKNARTVSWTAYEHNEDMPELFEFIENYN